MTTSARVLGVLGIVLYLAVGWFYLVSGLVVPSPWYFVLLGIWFAGWWLVVRVFKERRALTPLVAVLAAGFWFVYITVGEAFLGWTA
ncbi:MAG: hypothetical protein R3258_05960 [Acidimicrobiia bacterium]|nr:hypothetical protein [Acidimicrobiia bacterium]